MKAPSASPRSARTSLLSSVLVLSGALSSAGCAQHHIANTEVDDNDLNRRVVEFCEEYRHAVERRNTQLLLRLADPRYYEDGGSVDTSDDLDFAGLKAYLEDKFRKAKAIRYEIHYRDISLGRNKEILVDFTYSASYKVPTEAGDVWRRRVADNRLELVREGESFKILSGM